MIWTESAKNRQWVEQNLSVSRCDISVFTEIKYQKLLHKRFKIFSLFIYYLFIYIYFNSFDNNKVIRFVALCFIIQ